MRRAAQARLPGRPWTAAILMALAAMLAMAIVPGRAAAQQIVVEDTLGRTVTLEQPARRIVMGAGRLLPVLGLIHPDPASLLVGWRGDFKLDQAQYAAWRERFPALEELPVIGSNAAEGLPVEVLIALEPDLVVLSLYDAEATETSQSLALLDRAGIPVIVVDFFLHPLANTLPSLHMLGKAIGREEQAQAFTDFYQQRIERVRSRLAGGGEKRPSVFMHVHAGGMPCCPTPGHGIFNDMIELAGARNIALEHVPGPYGDVPLEQLLVDDPQIYIATGGSHLASRGGLVLGPGVTGEEAAAGFERLLTTPGLDTLAAVRGGSAYGLWHMFNDTPAHIAMIEWLAGIFHPRLFADVDPQDTLDAINRDFAAVPLTGTFWISR